MDITKNNKKKYKLYHNEIKEIKENVHIKPFLRSLITFY